MTVCLLHDNGALRESEDRLRRLEDFDTYLAVLRSVLS